MKRKEGEKLLMRIKNAVWMKYVFITPLVLVAYVLSPMALIAIKFGWQPKDAYGWPVERIVNRPFRSGARVLIQIFRRYIKVVRLYVHNIMKGEK